MSNEGILLESGTNEVEILEFELGGQSFGVNVLKIQAIELHDPKRVTHIQLSHPSVVGTLLFRDNCITLIDLGQEMETTLMPELAARGVGDPASSVEAIDEAVEAVVAADDDLTPYAEQDAATADDGELVSGEYAAAQKLVLVMEFNNLKTAFLVDGVNRIHRVSWEAISPLSPYLASTDSKFTGSLNIGAQEILLIDMEKIVTEILPGGQSLFGVRPDTENPNFAARADRTVYLAEDSSIIRETVRAELAAGNYVNVQTFANGQECLERITELKAQAEVAGKSLTDVLHALISDIEMPQLDGLTLCRRIKEELREPGLPVIMFSSLINDQITVKCEEVKADACITKPQFSELVQLLDKMCIEKAGAPA